MLMKCGPWFAAVESVLNKEEVEKVGGGGQRTDKYSNVQPSPRIIMTSPAGKPFTQRDAEMFASLAAPDPSSTSTSNLHLIFLCGHYEGFDARIETLVTDKYSVGDFVMTGGELAAAAMTDAIVRLLPGVLGGGPAATANESFSIHHSSLLTPHSSLLEAPQYTHPPEFRGMKVPEVLLSGDHAKIEAWRAAESRKLTAQARPDLL